MLQITSSGGSYPRETLPPFFNLVSPYLPMTYVVSGLRDIISGSQLAVEPVMVTFGLCIVILVLATAVFKRINAQVEQALRQRWARPRQLAASLADGSDLPLAPDARTLLTGKRPSALVDRPLARLFKGKLKLPRKDRRSESRK
jgi:hypothetical protein